VPELTPTQARAVTHAGGALLVLGGAGSGKTTVLARRFAWLVAHEHAAPESILVLTPSAVGASALRRAVEDTLDRPYEELAIHTVRDLCVRLLREETAEAGVDPFFAAVTRADRLALLLDRMDDLHLRSHDIGGRPAVLLADVIDRIDRLKDGLVTAADYAAWAQALPDGDDPERARAAREAEFAQLYLDHDRLLAAVGALDAGELVLRAVALLRERPHVRTRVAERYRHVLVDEYADLGFAAALLVELLGAEHEQLTVCADDDGAAHRMRAAAAKNVRDFEQSHPGAEVVRLERSLRCPADVLSAARAVVEPIADRLGTTLSAARAGGTVRFWCAADERAQAQAVAAEVERLVRGGVAPERIGVIVRSPRDEGRQVTLAFEERAIALRAVGEADFFAQAEVRDVLAWLRLLADPSDAGAVCARWRGRRSRCARLTSRAACRSPGAASSTWSRRCARRPSRRSFRPRRASTSTRSCACIATPPARWTARAPTSSCTGSSTASACAASRSSPPRPTSSSGSSTSPGSASWRAPTPSARRTRRRATSRATRPPSRTPACARRTASARRRPPVRSSSWRSTRPPGATWTGSSCSA